MLTSFKDGSPFFVHLAYFVPRHNDSLGIFEQGACFSLFKGFHHGLGALGVHLYFLEGEGRSLGRLNLYLIEVLRLVESEVEYLGGVAHDDVGIALVGILNIEFHCCSTVEGDAQFLTADFLAVADCQLDTGPSLGGCHGVCPGIVSHLLGILHFYFREVCNAVLVEYRFNGLHGLVLRLYVLRSEVVHVVVVPVGSHLMCILGIEADLLCGSVGQVVIGSDIGVRRADVVLHTDGGDDRRLVADAGSEVLRVEVREESIHLFVGHVALVLAGNVCGPVHDLKVVGEVAHEGNTRGDSLELATTQSGSGVGERTALALSLSIEVGHVARRARSHEVERTHAVHVGTAVVVFVLVAEVEGEPVTVGVGEVAVDAVGTLCGRTVVHRLSASGEDKLGIACRQIVAIAAKTPRLYTLSTGTVA